MSLDAIWEWLQWHHASIPGFSASKWRTWSIPRPRHLKWWMSRMSRTPNRIRGLWYPDIFPYIYIYTWFHVVTYIYIIWSYDPLMITYLDLDGDSIYNWGYYAGISHLLQVPAKWQQRSLVSRPWDPGLLKRVDTENTRWCSGDPHL